MKVVDAICEILKREGVEFLSCYPTNTLIEAAAAAGIKPIVCRQERVGVGIADGFTRITNGKRIGVQNWLTTTAVWARGLLEDEYGLDPKSVTWVADRVSGVGEDRCDRGTNHGVVIDDQHRITHSWAAPHASAALNPTEAS